MPDEISIMETATSYINGVHVALATMGPRKVEGERFLGINIYVGDDLIQNARVGDVFPVNGENWKISRMETAKPPRKGTVFFRRAET